MVGAAHTEQLEGDGAGALATLVTRATGLRSVSVYEPEHLRAIAASCVAKRAVGSSTEHAQSSRSHALLRMDVTTAPVLAAEAELELAKPQKKDKIIVVEGTDRGLGAELIGVDNEDGVIKMDATKEISIYGIGTLARIFVG